MRQCPTLRGDERPLFAHSIVNGVCMQRQREFYHKCHRCVFGGKPTDFVPDPTPDALHRNGTVQPEGIEVVAEAPLEPAVPTLPNGNPLRGPAGKG